MPTDRQPFDQSRRGDSRPQTRLRWEDDRRPGGREPRPGGPRRTDRHTHDEFWGNTSDRHEWSGWDRPDTDARRLDRRPADGRRADPYGVDPYDDTPSDGFDQRDWAPRRRPVDDDGRPAPMSRPRQRSAFVEEVYEQRSRTQRAASGPAGRRWVPAAAAASLIVGAIGVGMSRGSNDQAIQTTVSTSLPVVVDDGVPSTPPGTEPEVTEPSVVVTTVPEPTKSKLRRTLKINSRGAEVVALQDRLRALGFKPDDKKGTFGPLTRASVWAFEKLVLGTPALKAKGIVTNDVWQTMQDDILIAPRRTQTTPMHVEIYLPQQVLIIFQHDQPVFISHISSGKVDKDGKPALYREVLKAVDTDQAGNPLPVPKPEVAVMAYSKTPGGVFRVRRKETGVHKGRLGGMLNPVFFNYGIAMHGGYRVPLTRESHGCVRVPNAISHYLIELLNRGDQVFVWDGKKEPEKQSRLDSQPSFNRLDPSVPTTVDLPPASTLPPRPTKTTVKTTVKPPATTIKPPPKTTVKPPPKTTVKTTTTVDTGGTTP